MMKRVELDESITALKPPTVIDRLTQARVMELLFSVDQQPQEEFRHHFANELQLAAEAIADGFNAYKELSDQVSIEHRNAIIMLFLHTTINSLYSSLHLLVSGYPVPAGHMMRQFSESAAMAMLCADTELDVYARYAADPAKYPVHKAVHFVLRKDISESLRKSLAFQADGYAQFARVMKFYDKLSHISVVALGHAIQFTPSGGLAFGPQFDPTKVEIYRLELRRIRSACRTVRLLAAALTAVLPKKNPAPSAD
ncbi:MAG TPA: hypothetical protein VJU82_18215 [Acidobacteriaceae bacterium]|nr:hypothetical protein [Acidobacteriaceae bacterium]